MDLTDAFEDWLLEHFDPDLTQKGSVRTTGGGLPAFSSDDLQTLRTLLGCSLDKNTLTEARKGNAPPQVKAAMKRCVELEDLESIRQARRDQAFLETGQHAVRHAERFGHAPDGGSVSKWLIRLRKRLASRFDVDKRLGGEALELWKDHAVQNRRRRRAA